MNSKQYVDWKNMKLTQLEAMLDDGMVSFILNGLVKTALDAVADNEFLTGAWKKLREGRPPHLCFNDLCQFYEMVMETDALGTDVQYYAHIELISAYVQRIIEFEGE